MPEILFNSYAFKTSKQMDCYKRIMDYKSTDIQLTPLDRKGFLQHRDELVQLYLHAFTTGELAQYIPAETADKTLNELSLRGSGVMALWNDKIVGAIYGMSLAYDDGFPSERFPEISVDKAVYIAELMVHRDMRGRGVASDLIHTLLENEKAKGITDAVIRVWDKNKVALNLYKKLGFGEIAEITQQKMKADGMTTFSMSKIYLALRG